MGAGLALTVGPWGLGSAARGLTENARTIMGAADAAKCFKIFIVIPTATSSGASRVAVCSDSIEEWPVVSDYFRIVVEAGTDDVPRWHVATTAYRNVESGETTMGSLCCNEKGQRPGPGN